jgi:hypothetical protein
MSSFSIDEAFQSIADDVASLLAALPVKLGSANPPNVPGVYMLLVNDVIVYVGSPRAIRICAVGCKAWLLRFRRA